MMNTYAGMGSCGFGGDGGPATSAYLYCPVAIALGSMGDLYINDYHNGRIRMVVIKVVFQNHKLIFSPSILDRSRPRESSAQWREGDMVIVVMGGPLQMHACTTPWAWLCPLWGICLSPISGTTVSERSVWLGSVVSFPSYDCGC